MNNTVLILAPHPDDEIITGLFALRMKLEAAARVWVIPVTLGSDPGRQPARRNELHAACAAVDFHVHFLSGKNIYHSTSSAWAGKEKQIAAFLKQKSPAWILLPHAQDGHPVHRQTHRTGLAAMDRWPAEKWRVIESEYWFPLRHPNLMLEASRTHVKTLKTALACHVGEVARNDYDQRLGAWMEDNVRRGREIVGGRFGAGHSTPAMKYATLYRARLRLHRRWQSLGRTSGWIVPAGDMFPFTVVGG